MYKVKIRPKNKVNKVKKRLSENNNAGSNILHVQNQMKEVIGVTNGVTNWRNVKKNIKHAYKLFKICDW